MVEYAHPKLNFVINSLLVAVGLIAFAVPPSLGRAGAAAATALASPASAPYVATMTFDVASVRENKDIDLNAGYTAGGQFVPHTTTLRLTNMMIESLICTAYGVQQYQIAGAPDWPFPTFFMIEAKGDSAADAKIAALTEEQQWAEQEHMLRTLLEERFKLKTHWATKEGDVYNLVVAKGGPKLGAQGSMPVSVEEKKEFGDGPVSPLFQRCDAQGCEFIAHGFPMDQLVRTLTGQLRRPVIDKTGLTGNYDFVLKYKGARDADRPADDMNPTPPMDRAIQEQLGLKVEAAKGPVKMLVIDHVEKPSEN